MGEVLAQQLPESIFTIRNAFVMMEIVLPLREKIFLF